MTGYETQRRRKRAAWEDVATSMATEIELEHQQPGVEYEYRVLGFNRAGEGRPSSTARAVPRGTTIRDQGAPAGRTAPEKAWR